MHILFVAPQSNLAADAELAHIAAGNQIDMCVGYVDRAKLALALGGREYEVVHFAQHGTRALLALSDGLLEAGELVAMLQARQHNLRFIVLNSCESIAAAITLHNALMIPVVAHNAPIDDAAAVRFAEAFYRNIAVGMSVEAAVEAARTVLLRIYPTEAGSPTLINGARASVADLGAKMDGLSHDMAGIRREVSAGFARVDARIDGLQLTGSRHVRIGAKIVIALLAVLTLAQILTPVFNSILARR